MRLAVPATLAALSLLLLGGIAYESLAPLDPVVVDVPHVPKHMQTTAPAPTYVPPPESDYAEIDARSPFSSARQPLADPSAHAAASASSDFALVGVIMNADRAVALIRSRSGNTTTSAVLGDVVNGWRVVKVEATSVTLRANGSDAVVGLDGPAAGPASAPLTRPTAATTATTTTTAPAATPALAPATTQTPAQIPGTTAPPPKGYHPTIAPEALRGAPIDPTTGEPTL